MSLAGNYEEGAARRRRGSRAAGGELTVFLSPALSMLAWVWQRLHLVIAGIAALYAVSGVSIIEANEVGIVRRLGAFTRSAGIPIVHGPGIVLALPKPFDEVLTVEVDRIDTILIDELAPVRETGAMAAASPFDGSVPGSAPGAQAGETPRSPSIQGHVLTGDRNVLHARLAVRYRVIDAVELLLLASDPRRFLRAVLLESTTKVAGARRLDTLLGEGREQFAEAVAADAQARLDRIGVGLEVVSIELESLSPPAQVAEAFDMVQSSYIEAQTRMREAQAYAAEAVPAAQATAREHVTRAHAKSIELIADERAQSRAFAALLPAYGTAPSLLRQRLYRERVESALAQVGQVRLVPPPGRDGYQGTRLVLSLPGGQARDGRGARPPADADPGATARGRVVTVALDDAAVEATHP